MNYFLEALVANLKRRDLDLVSVWVSLQDEKHAEGIVLVDRRRAGYEFEPFVTWVFDVRYLSSIEPVVSTYSGHYGDRDEAVRSYFQRLGFGLPESQMDDAYVERLAREREDDREREKAQA